MTTIPNEIKKRIEKTATYAARYGERFEKQIKEREINNPQYSFMIIGDKYYSYYREQVKLLIPTVAIPPTSTTNNTSNGNAEQQQQPPTTVVTPPPIMNANIISPPQPKEQIQQQQQAQVQAPPPKELKVPDPLLYIVDIPDGMTALELDTILLTAQFIAQNGQGFHQELSNRETKNSQFDFLKSTHHLNGWFRCLVESYAQIIYPPKDLKVQLQSPEFIDKQTILERAINRFEYDKKEELARKKADEEANNENMVIMAIDWDDFVIVDTIEFYSEDLDDLPQPKTYEQLLKMDNSIFNSGSVNNENQNQEMDVEMDDNTADMDDGGGDMDMDQDDEPKLKVIKDYTKTVKTVATHKLTKKCPYCQQDIPLDELTEHMRIEQFQRSNNKQQTGSGIGIGSTSNGGIDMITPTISNDDEISKNLQNFFGGEKTNQSTSSSTNKVIWDGYTSSIPRLQAALQQQQQQQQNPIDNSAGRQQQQQYQQQIKQQQQQINNPYGMPFMYPPGGIPPPFGMQPPFLPPHGLPLGVMMPPPPLPLTSTSGDMMSMNMDDDNEDRSAKRYKIEFSLIPESEYLATHSGPVQLTVEDTDEKSENQTIYIQLQLTDTISVLKDHIKSKLGMAPNKQKLKTSNISVLKDNCTIAFYNLNQDTTVFLGQKERGGRKK